MSNIIQFRQGLLKDLTQPLKLGEPAIALDTKQLFFGGLDGKNFEIGARGFALADVSGLRATAAANSISLYWSEPSDVAVQGVVLAQWQKTIIVYRTDRYPNNETDGTVLVENTVRDKYATTPYQHTGLVTGQTIYYQAFPISTTGVANTNTTNRVSAKTVAVPLTPPGNVLSFAAKAGNTQITLTWGDPADVTGTNPVTWAGTRIVRNDTRYPTSETDGTIVKNSTVRNQYKTTGLVDTGLTNDKTYYYQAFPYSTQNAFNTNTANRVSAKPVSTPTLGYTGEMQIFNSVHPTKGTERFYAALTTSGTLTTNMAIELDVYLVNAGSNGAAATGTPGIGGTGGVGGLTKNLTKVALSSSIALIIGATAAAATKWGSETPGTSPTNVKKPFNGDVAPFSTMPFAGDGGRGGDGHTTASYTSNSGTAGQAGGGGRGGDSSWYKSTTPSGWQPANSGSGGTANTGGGGGGGGGKSSMGPDTTANGSGGPGGSGIIIIRWGDWST